jgi:hypothetical protein
MKPRITVITIGIEGTAVFFDLRAWVKLVIWP